MRTLTAPVAFFFGASVASFAESSFFSSSTCASSASLAASSFFSAARCSIFSAFVSLAT